MDPDQQVSKPAKPQQGPRATIVGPYHWVSRALGYLLVMGLGAIYGATLYGFFRSISKNSFDSGSGLMLVSFLVGVPLVIGIIVGFFANRKKMGMVQSASLTTFSMCLFVFAAGALFREGFICIVMAAPILIFFGIIGTAIGQLFDDSGGTRGPKFLSVAVLLPALTGPVESELTSKTVRQTVHSSIFIEAQPEAVWHHINYPTDIRPNELKDGFAYQIGVPYPIEARTLEERVGGKRELKWQRGVSFEEIITAWEPNQHIAWRYSFRPDSFPPGSLDDHIVIGGRYFNLEDTSYTITPEGTGVRLSIQVGTSVSTHFNWYADLWARFLIGDTAEAILRFYKQRSERTASETRSS